MNVPHIFQIHTANLGKRILNFKFSWMVVIQVKVGFTWLQSSSKRGVSPWALPSNIVAYSYQPVFMLFNMLLILLSCVICCTMIRTFQWWVHLIIDACLKCINFVLYFHKASFFEWHIRSGKRIPVCVLSHGVLVTDLVIVGLLLS